MIRLNLLDMITAAHIEPEQPVETPAELADAMTTPEPSMLAKSEQIARIIALEDALAAMVARYASEDVWEVPVECDETAWKLLETRTHPDGTTSRLDKFWWKKAEE